MPIYALDGESPQFLARDSVFLAPDATLIGRVSIGRRVGVWFGAVLRGDNEPIVVGDDSNLQEHTVLHTDMGFPLTVGRGATIGHRAILHGCTIGDNSLVGMGAIVLNGARIGRDSLVGAGSLVTEGKAFADGMLIVGTPARPVRPLTAAEIEGLRASAAHYAQTIERYAKGFSCLEAG